MRKLLLILYTYFGLSSCGEVSIKEEIIKLNSRPITLPINAKVTYNGKDTIITDLFNSNCKFIVYFDSIECSSCSVKRIHLWKNLLNYAVKNNDKLRFYFIFNPDNDYDRDLRISLLSHPLNYPILIDLKGDFEKLNSHLPKNKELHTFLLDENNKVILVGNPLNNKEIEKLFYKKTQELLSK